MVHNQKKFIEYVMRFAEENRKHIWLSGSFKNAGATMFSDVDISVWGDYNVVHDLIYGYGKPVYISFTLKPLGILIVIYEDGVAVDLEIIEKIEVSDEKFFHTDVLKIYDYIRNEEVYKNILLTEDKPYQVARLFHRSLIKFLSGKRKSGVSIANEIVAFCELDDSIDEVTYKDKFNSLLTQFHEKYRLPSEYYNILCELMDML